MHLGKAVAGIFLMESISFATNMPSTPKFPTEETVQGVKIADPYRWLENAASKDVVAWTEAQNNWNRASLDQSPSLELIRTKLEAWNSVQSAKYFALSFAQGTYFALKLQPPRNQPFLVALTSLEDTKSEHVVFDPNLLNPKGTTAIDWYEASRDGKKIALSISENGSELGTLHVVALSGQELGEAIPRVHGPTAGGSVAWNHDGSGFFYTRYPAKGERPDEDLSFYQQTYFHRIGTPVANDRYELGKDFPKIAEIKLSASASGEFILAAVANGDGGEYAHYVRSSSGQWQTVTTFSDGCKNAWFGENSDLLLLSRKDHPRGQILRLPLSQLVLAQAKLLVPESDAVIESVTPTKQRLFVTDLVGGISQIRAFDVLGALVGIVPVPHVSTVYGAIAGKKGNLVFNVQSYTEAPAWVEYDPLKKTIHKTALFVQSPVSFADVEVLQEWAESKDHTRIPVTILMRKGLRSDGSNPALLSAYGGYGISMTPRFNADLHIWLENGGIYALANIRGGGEFGEEWHLQGNLTKKQNVFDDFIGAAEHLVKQHYTNPKRLAITGRSNGGLLMGAALTQRPDLFAAVVSGVGIYDMVHVEDDPNGTFNITEFGTKKNADQFKALYAYSPYHNVTDGTKYPAVLLITGAHDGRVEPYHSKKMTARLQEASKSGAPVLLRVTFDGGHGMGRSTSQKVAEEADSYAFLFDQLGMKTRTR